MDPDTPTAPWPDHVRPAGDSDLAVLVDLAEAFYREDGFTTARDHLHANMRVLLGGAGHIAVAVRDEQVVGFAVTTTTFGLEYGLIAELTDLYVAPDCRRAGFGDALITDAADWVCSRGVTRLELVIAPNGGDPAHLAGYYARRGFLDDGRQLRHLPLDPPQTS